jgi:hypothetical protein
MVGKAKGTTLRGGKRTPGGTLLAFMLEIGEEEVGGTTRSGLGEYRGTQKGTLYALMLEMGEEKVNATTPREDKGTRRGSLCALS